MAAKRGSAIQRKNRDYVVGKGKPPVEHQFKPNDGDQKDPKINRHGRPKNHDQLRALIQRIAGESVDGKPEWSQIELMLRAMMKSKQAQDRKEILEHGWGKVKDEVDHTIRGEIEVKAVDYRVGTSAIAPRPVPDSDTPGEAQEAGDGPALGEDGAGRRHCP